MFHKKTRKYPTTRMIALGFLCAIGLGTILLSLPISSKNGASISVIDALFMSTTSICVTGLTTVSVAEQFSLFGQLVILLFMQFGGLGVVTFTTTVLFLFGRRIRLKERMLIQEAYNLDTLNGLVKLTKQIVKGTLIVEGVGALIFSFCFVPSADHFFHGVWQAIFQSVSAFCNAGMDILGSSSLAAYRDNVAVNITTMLLIIIGGIGFPVWWNLIEIGKKCKNQDVPKRRFLLKLNLHTQLVLISTFALIIGGAVLTFLIERNNPATLGSLNGWQQWQAAFFQSVTTRTAGFYTIPQENFLPSSSIVYLVMMFIGGSPSGTAGGVKTVTILVLLVSTISIIKGKRDIEIFSRKITEQHLRKVLAVVVVSFSALIVMSGLLASVQQSEFLDTVYETTSAMATVGLSRNLTGSLKTAGKIVIVICMYLGRIGPITMALAFNISGHGVTRTLPEGKVIIG